MQGIMDFVTRNPWMVLFLAFIVFCLIKGGKGKGGGDGTGGSSSGGGTFGGGGSTPPTPPTSP